MVIERGEDSISRLRRHIKEAEEMIEGWISELRRENTKSMPDYKNHCKAMIKIWENTLIELKKSYGELDENY